MLLLLSGYEQIIIEFVIEIPRLERAEVIYTEMCIILINIDIFLRL